MGLLKKIKWFVTLGGKLHVHSLPILCGALVASGIAALQSSGVLTLNASLFMNQTVLDSICNATSVCLTLDQGASTILTALSFLLFANLFERFYLAESPKYKILQKANEAAEKIIDKVESVPTLYAEYPEKTRMNSTNNINKG